MASIEATKRAFGDAETAQRRRHRAERERKGSDKGGQEGASNGGKSRQGIERDPAFCFYDNSITRMLLLDFLMTRERGCCLTATHRKSLRE